MKVPAAFIVACVAAACAAATNQTDFGADRNEIHTEDAGFDQSLNKNANDLAFCGEGYYLSGDATAPTESPTKAPTDAPTKAPTPYVPGFAVSKSSRYGNSATYQNGKSRPAYDSCTDGFMTGLINTCTAAGDCDRYDRLDFNNCYGMTDSGLKALADAMPNIIGIDLEGVEISENALDYATQNMELTPYAIQRWSYSHFWGICQ